MNYIELNYDIKVPQPEAENIDVILITNDYGLTVADRKFLSQNSEFFRSTFSGPNADDVAINIEHVDSATLDAILDFYYTDSICIDVNNVNQLFRAAHHLRFDTVMYRCVDFFLKHLNAHNFWQCFQIGAAFNVPKIMNAAHAYAVKNFTEIVDGSEQLVQVNVERLAAIFSDINLCVENEITVFHAMVIWLKHSFKKRLPFIPKLMSLIHLSQLDIDFLTTNAIFLAREAQCMPLVEQAIYWARNESTQRKVKYL